MHLLLRQQILHYFVVRSTAVPTVVGQGLLMQLDLHRFHGPSGTPFPAASSNAERQIRFLCKLRYPFIATILQRHCGAVIVLIVKGYVYTYFFIFCLRKISITHTKCAIQVTYPFYGETFLKFIRLIKDRRDII